jgi:hypothetical protein
VEQRLQVRIVTCENGGTIDLLVDHVTGPGRIISQGVLNNGKTLHVGVPTPGRSFQVFGHRLAGEGLQVHQDAFSYRKLVTNNRFI